ncbi:MAG: HAMP domain-containing sensor histidine kinase [Sideroxydans sp.]|nr:HAMP domain-containing sensor histidine kinase [Sideroxydans sp.]
MFNLHNPVRAVQELFRTGQIFGKLNLQARFLLIIGASSLIITLLLWLSFGNLTEHLIERLGSRLAEKQMLYDRERTLQPLIREISMARETADSRLLREWARNEADPIIRQRALLKMEKMRDHFRGGNYFIAFSASRNFYYNDAAGQYDGHQLRYTLDPAALDDAWFFDFLVRGNEKRIRVAHNDELGVSKIWVRVPIMDGKKVIGVLGTGIDLDDFVRNISNISQPGVTNMFINQNAVIQIYNDVGHVDFPGVRNLPDHTHYVSQIQSRESGSQWLYKAIKALDLGDKIVDTEFVVIQGKRYLAGLIALPEVGWYDLTLLDLSVLLPGMDFFWPLVATICGALFLLGMLALSLHRLVIRPLATLTDSVGRIRRGEYTPEVRKEAGAGEVNTLAAQFHDMEDAVRSTHLWLETEIEKRTQQLIDAKNVLEISLAHERNGREIQATQMAVMAHELRSPLAVIGNTAQMLHMLVASDHPEWLPRIDKIMRSVRQLVGMVDNFLSEEWLDMGQHGLIRTQGNLNQLCTRLVANIAENQGRLIRYKPLSEDVALYADWQLLQIAISNMLDNACKYSCTGGEVGLSISSPRKDWICVEVKDCGAGIPEHLQERIFKKYARGEHTQDIQGSGIGLYLANWIAEFHGGHMEITSEAGLGNSFYLCLPISEAPAPKQ